MKNLKNVFEYTETKFLYKHPGVERSEDVENKIEHDGDDLSEGLESALNNQARSKALRESSLGQAKLKTKAIASAAEKDPDAFEEEAQERLEALRKSESTLDQSDDKSRSAQFKNQAETLYGSMNPEVGARKIEGQNKDMTDGSQNDETNQVGVA